MTAEQSKAPPRAVILVTLVTLVILSLRVTGRADFPVSVDLQ